MSDFFVPRLQTLEFAVNNIPVGLAESYSDRTVCDTRVIRSIGKNDDVAVFRGGQHHVVTVCRFLPDHKDFMTGLLNLHDFSFSVTREGRGFHFVGCELLSYTWRYDGEKGCLEEAEFYARQRIPMIVREVKNE